VTADVRGKTKCDHTRYYMRLIRWLIIVDSEFLHLFVYDEFFRSNYILYGLFGLWWWVSVTTAWRALRFRMTDRPPIWRVAANIFNTQSWKDDKEWSSSLVVGQGAKHSSTQ